MKSSDFGPKFVEIGKICTYSFSISIFGEYPTRYKKSREHFYVRLLKIKNFTFICLFYIPSYVRYLITVC
jgi:hypothetical protein